MEWLGDLLYPGNPGRRKEVNELQQSVIDGNTKLVDSVNTYNDQYKSVNTVASLNAVLQAMSYNAKLAREDIPKPEDSRVSAYSDSVLTQVVDFSSQLALPLSALVLLKRGWAVAKLKITNFKNSFGKGGGEGIESGEITVEEEAIDVASMGEEITANANLSVMEGSAEGSELASTTSTELSGLAEEAEGVLEASEFAEMTESAALVEGTVAEASVAGAEVTAASAFGALGVAAGVGLVIVIGVELIMSAINGDKERTELEKAIKKLHDAKEKIDKAQSAADKTSTSLNKIKTNAVDKYKKIIKAFRALEADLASHGKPSIVIPDPDYADMGSVIASQNFLVANFSTPISLIDSFRSLTSASDDGEPPLLKLDDFKNPEKISKLTLRLLSDEHKIDVTTLEIFMKWYYNLASAKSDPVKVTAPVAAAGLFSPAEVEPGHVGDEALSAPAPI